MKAFCQSPVSRKGREGRGVAAIRSRAAVAIQKGGEHLRECNIAFIILKDPRMAGNVSYSQRLRYGDGIYRYYPELDLDPEC